MYNRWLISAVYFRAWYLALEDAKALRQHAVTSVPPGYTTTAYPQQIVTHAYPGQYMYGSQPVGM